MADVYELNDVEANVALREVSRRIRDEILGNTGDPEVQHEREDALHVDVLRWIALHPDVPAEVRAVAVTAWGTTSIAFPRIRR